MQYFTTTSLMLTLPACSPTSLWFSWRELKAVASDSSDILREEKYVCSFPRIVEKTTTTAQVSGQWRWQGNCNWRECSDKPWLALFPSRTKAICVCVYMDFFFFFCKCQVSLCCMALRTHHCMIPLRPAPPHACFINWTRSDRSERQEINVGFRKDEPFL